MNDKELIGKVHSAVYGQCQRRGYTTHFVDSKKAAELKAQQNIEKPDWPKGSSHVAVLIFSRKRTKPVRNGARGFYAFLTGSCNTTSSSAQIRKLLLCQVFSFSGFPHFLP